jgi:mono/diheme cytochrome c family protein
MKTSVERRTVQALAILGAVAAPVLLPAAWGSGDLRKTRLREGGPGLYKTYCATCHGREGRGDGPTAQFLRTVPPDLTLLARHNKGRYDGEKIHRIIDGRDPVKYHGGADMPLWGDAFKESREGYGEARVKERIDALVEHLRSLQQQSE